MYKILAILIFICYAIFLTKNLLSFQKKLGELKSLKETELNFKKAKKALVKSYILTQIKLIFITISICIILIIVKLWLEKKL